MEQLDRILAKYTDPAKGSLHAAVFIVVDSSGTLRPGVTLTE